jgi:hypothetical protein
LVTVTRKRRLCLRIDDPRHFHMPAFSQPCRPFCLSIPVQTEPERT